MISKLIYKGVNKVNIDNILSKLSLSEEEALFLFKHLMSEAEEESYEASQKMFEDVAKRLGYSSYNDYLKHSPECF